MIHYILVTSKCPTNPYSSMLTDELVEAAIRREYGDDSSLIEYKVEDFTKKGDNFASVVTSVKVSESLKSI